MNALTLVRILWTACIVLFLAGLAGLRWGTKLSIALLPPAQQLYADADLLHSEWIRRSIFLFLMSSVCGLLGIYFSARAADTHSGPQ
jgi:hypothetical protein